MLYLFHKASLARKVSGQCNVRLMERVDCVMECGGARQSAEGRLTYVSSKQEV